MSGCFFENEPVVSEEFLAYGSRGLPIHPVNIKSRRLNRLEKRKSCREYRTADIDPNVMNFVQKYFVQKYWRLRDSATLH
jgi:hypothetical protein